MEEKHESPVKPYSSAPEPAKAPAPEPAKPAPEPPPKADLHAERRKEVEEEWHTWRMKVIKEAGQWAPEIDTAAAILTQLTLQK